MPLLTKVFFLLLVMFTLNMKVSAETLEKNSSNNTKKIEKPLEQTNKSKKKNLAQAEVSSNENNTIKTKKPDELAVQIGDVATWFSSLFTAAVFFFTLHAWREERLRAKKLEVKETINLRFAEANKISAWMEKSKPSLRMRTGASEKMLPDGSWALIVENGASYTLFSWRTRLTIKNPALEIETSSQHYGPIGPRGGVLVLPIDGISSEADPKVGMEIEFEDDNRQFWIRTNEGLTFREVE